MSFRKLVLFKNYEANTIDKASMVARISKRFMILMPRFWVEELNKRMGKRTDFGM